MEKLPAEEGFIAALVAEHGVGGAARRLGVHVRTLRRRLARGPSTPRRGLSADDAREIRDLYFTDGYTQAQLGASFGVSQSMVARIVNNRAFREDPVGTLSGSADVAVGYKVQGGAE